jgi:prephenate dehydrogenase
MSFRRISIIGLGLIGGSVAMAIRDRLSDCEITGYDLNAKAMAEALASGAIHRSASSPGQACEGADCVVLCVPVGRIAEILAEIAPHLAPNTRVTDVCSTKKRVVEAAERALPVGVHFVGSHPMAGGELSGFSAARPDMFDGALCLTTPVPQTNPQALDAVEGMWRSLGARIVRMSPEEHDCLVAQISHLPHVLASALVNAVSDEAMAVAGPGFRDVTRTAAGDGALWRDILLDNADEVCRSLARFRGELDRLEGMLRAGGGEELRTWLAQGARRRKALGKPGM